MVSQELEEGFKLRLVEQKWLDLFYFILHFCQKQIQNSVPEDQLWNCSNYITALIFDVLKEMFYNARDIQVWMIFFPDDISLLHLL